jgi:hypothetical protein
MESQWVGTSSKLTVCLLTASHSDLEKETCLGELIIGVKTAPNRPFKLSSIWLCYIPISILLPSTEYTTRDGEESMIQDSDGCCAMFGA